MTLSSPSRLTTTFYMAKSNRKITLVNFILDKSGSMDSVRDATISGFNEYLKTLQKDIKSEYEFTLTLFDTMVTCPVLAYPVRQVKELSRTSYKPDGMTALYDAVCSTIRNVKERKDQKVICIIMTDGEENSSKEYDQVKMKELIDERTKKGNWTFVYLGANQDSYANASKFGISHMNAANFHSTGAGVGASMRNMAMNTMAYAASAEVKTDSFFSKEDQELLDSTK